MQSLVLKKMVSVEGAPPMEERIARRFEHLWTLVGNTPMLEILYEYKGCVRTIYVKCEHYNLTGSIKDRMALYILQKAYERGEIKRGDRIVLATTGNSGISFSALGRALGHPVTIIAPDTASRERIDLMRSLGADVLTVSRKEGGFTGALKRAEEMASLVPGIFGPRPFENGYSSEAHAKTTAPEVWQQLRGEDLLPEAFVAGVGTGGTVMGLQHFFNRVYPRCSVYPVEPAESPTLTSGFKVGTHRIRGIVDEFIPPIVDLEKLGTVLPVSDGDAIITAQKLARELGLGVGISSGANILGAVQLQNRLGDQAVVVTVLSDSNKKYLSTDLLKEEPPRPSYLSNSIQFLDYSPIRRLPT